MAVPETFRRPRTPIARIVPILLGMIAGAPAARGALAAAAPGAGQATPQPSLPALATKPDAAHHVTVDPNLYPWSSVGKIFNSIGGACTGFVIAPERIATAGHCVYAFRTHRFLPPDAIHVLLGYDRGDYRVHARVTRYTLGPGYDPNNEKGTAAADWAVLDLAEALPAAIRPLAAGKVAPGRGTKIMIGGFARDRAYVMTTDRDCRILDAIEGGKLLSHDCLTAPGDSGAPVLAAGPDGQDFVYLGVTIANWRVGDKQVGIATAGSNLILQAGAR